MEKLNLSITKQLRKNPSAGAQFKDRLGTSGFNSALRTSDASTLELLESGYADIAVIRNAVAYETLKKLLETGQTDVENVPKVLQTSTGIDSGMRLFWSAAYGDSIWQNGLRAPRLCTPFPNAKLADVEIANAWKEKPSPIPMMYKIDEGLSETEIDFAKTYTPAVIAEALYFLRANGIKAKLGPTSEAEFDNLIAKSIQPECPDYNFFWYTRPFEKSATRGNRVYFKDDPDTVVVKLNDPDYSRWVGDISSDFSAELSILDRVVDISGRVRALLK